MTPLARIACFAACALIAAAAQAAPPGEQAAPPGEQAAPPGEHAHHGSLEGAAPASDHSVWQLPGEWTDQAGRTFALASLRGSPTLLAFFYGTCESVCPILVRDLGKLEALLPPADRARTRFVLVTIDPLVDTPERLRDYAGKHDLDPARWTLLHGGPEQVRVLANVLGVKYRPSGGGQYSHTLRITLLDGDGVVADHFDGLERPLEPIAARTRALLGE